LIELDTVDSTLGTDADPAGTECTLGWMAWLTFRYCGVCDGRDRVELQGICRGLYRLDGGDLREPRGENLCTAGLIIHLMNVRPTATFLLCGMMHRFQPPMFELPG
jgi:hypothetical protein